MRNRKVSIPNRRRRSDAPAVHVARLGWMLLTLLGDGVLECADCIDRFGISRRQLQRDLRDLREIGKAEGLIVERTEGGRVFAYYAGRRASPYLTRNRNAAQTLARIAMALGGPAESEMREAIGDTAADMHSGFLHLREASPSDSVRVSKIFAFLKEAAAGPARVEFSYAPARGARSVRCIEPYHVVARSGRYYLVAYDLERRDWRQFALDAISGPWRKVGTFTRRAVPERFLAERTVGWIRGSRSAEVTIRVSPVVAAAVGSRTWQREQRVKPLPDGGAEVTLSFDDLGEAVRFALGFGTEAVVVAPPEAVALARETVAGIGQFYQDREAPAKRKLAG
jgi:predicted DNA-binding transcriptional regulator YafY